MADDLKNLPPEERIKRLKELEEKKKKEMEEQRKAIEQQKKEIEEAEKEIKNAQGELNEKRKVKEKVPIVEVASDSGEGLSEEAKLILKVMQKKVVGRKEDVGEQEEKQGEREKSGGNAEKRVFGREKLAGFSVSALEEKVHHERVQMAGQFQGGMGGGDYVTALSQQPAQQLYQQMSALYQTVEVKGYMNQEEQRRVQYLASAVERKIEDVEAGRYSMSEDAGRAASVTKQMVEAIRGMYKSGGKERKEQDWYKSG